MGWADRKSPPVEHRLEPGPTGRVQTAFMGCCRIRRGIAVVAANAAAGDAAAVAIAVAGGVAVAVGAAAAAAAAATDVVAAAAAAAAAAVAALWPPASPLALQYAERPNGAKRGHAGTTLMPPPALGPAHMLRYLRLQLMAWGPC